MKFFVFCCFLGIVLSSSSLRAKCGNRQYCCVNNSVEVKKPIEYKSYSDYKTSYGRKWQCVGKYQRKGADGSCKKKGDNWDSTKGDKHCSVWPEEKWATEREKAVESCKAII